MIGRCVRRLGHGALVRRVLGLLLREVHAAAARLVWVGRVVAEVNRYRATAELDGKSWLVHVEGDSFDRYTSVRHLRDVDVYARDLVVSVLDTDPEQVAVELRSG